MHQINDRNFDPDDLNSENDQRTESLVKGLSGIRLTLITNFVLAILGFLTGILKARLLGPIGVGEFTAIQTWPSTIASLAVIGLPESTVYFISKNNGKGREFTATAMVIAFLSVVICDCLFWFLLPMLLHSESTSVINAGRIYLLVGLIYALFGLPHGSLQGMQNFKWWNILRLVPALTWIIVLITNLVAKQSSAILLSRWLLFGIFISSVPSFLIVFKKIKGKFRFKAIMVRPLISYGLPSVTASIPQTINLRLDQLLIMILLPPKYLGYYVVAVAWSNGILPILRAIGSVAFPIVSGERDTEIQKSITQRALQSCAFIGLVLGGFLGCLTPIAIPLLFGNLFSKSVISALILVPAGIILVWAGVAEDIIRGYGQPKYVLMAEVLGAVFTIASLMILLNILGIAGAALASLIGYSIVALFCATYICKRSHLKLVSLFIPSRDTIKLVVAEVIRPLSVAFRKIFNKVS